MCERAYTEAEWPLTAEWIDVTSEHPCFCYFVCITSCPWGAIQQNTLCIFVPMHWTEISISSRWGGYLFRKWASMEACEPTFGVWCSKLLARPWRQASLNGERARGNAWMMEEDSMTVCIMPLSAQRLCCASRWEREEDARRGETYIIASFTRSQPTIHAFRQTQTGSSHRCFFGEYRSEARVHSFLSL